MVRPLEEGDLARGRDAGDGADVGDIAFFDSFGVDSPLLEGIDGFAWPEAVREDEGDGFVDGVFKPVEFASVNVHRMFKQ